MTRKICLLAWPAVIEFALQTLVQYIDYIMVGRLGVNEAAAVGLTTELNFLVKGPLNAAGIGVLTYISVSIGAKRYEKVRAASVQALILALIVGGAEWLLVMGLSPFIPTWLGADPEIRKEAFYYFAIISLPLVFQSLNIVCGSALRGTGDMKTPMLVNAAVNVLNIVLNTLLIYDSRWIKPAGIQLKIWGAGLGIYGAAIATAVSIAAGGILMVWGFYRNQQISPKGYKFSIEPAIMKKCVQVGIPVALNRIVSSLGRVVFTAFVTSLGIMQLATHTIAFTAESAFYIPVVGFQAAVTTLAGNVLGENNSGKLRKLVLMSNIIIAGIMVIMGTLLFFFAAEIIGVFTKDEQVIQTGADLLRIVSVSEPVFAVSIVLEGIFNGIGDTKGPFLISVISMWIVRVGDVYLCIHVFGFGLHAVWLCMVGDNVLRCLLLFIRYKRERWAVLFRVETTNMQIQKKEGY